MQIQFQEWRNKPLVWLGLLLGLNFTFGPTMEFCRISRDLGEPIQIFEPYIVIGSSAWDMLFVFLGLVLILADAPFVDALTPSMVMRSSRRQWFLAQILYIASVSCVYYMILALFSALVCAGVGYVGNLWSSVLNGIAAGSSAYDRYLVDFGNVAFLKQYSPTSALLLTIACQFSYGLILELIVFLLNLTWRRAYGICVALSIHIIGYVTFLEGIVGLKKLSLMVNALPAMHGTRFSHSMQASPTWFESLLIGLCLTCVLIISAMHRARKFDFYAPTK
jgi:hypothetical protein